MNEIKKSSKFKFTIKDKTRDYKLTLIKLPCSFIFAINL